VVRVGSRVQRFKPGDEVYARPPKDRIGTFAEFIAIKEAAVALKPKTLSMEEAASIPLVALTAWQALVEKGQLKKGQKVLIHAGSGGVGTFAIQLAKHLGAIVATTASAANAELMKQLGADIVIDYKKDDFTAVLKDCDVVLDTQGGNTLEGSLRVLKTGGKVIGIAGPPDPDFAKQMGASLFLNTAMRFLSYRIRRAAKRRNVTYSFLFMRADGDQLGQIATLIDSGAIRPVIDRIFPFTVSQHERLWLMSKRDVQRVKSSSRSDRGRDLYLISRRVNGTCSSGTTDAEPVTLRPCDEASGGPVGTRK
jgi:alcohol dehydrogenase